MWTYLNTSHAFTFSIRCCLYRRSRGSQHPRLISRPSICKILHPRELHIYCHHHQPREWESKMSRDTSFSCFSRKSSLKQDKTVSKTNLIQERFFIKQSLICLIYLFDGDKNRLFPMFIIYSASHRSCIIFFFPETLKMTLGRTSEILLITQTKHTKSNTWVKV